MSTAVESVRPVETFRPTRTFSFWTEFKRQASRRRTQLALGFMVVLPLIILIAFQLDSGNDDGGGRRNGQFSSLVNLATAGGQFVRDRRPQRMPAVPGAAGE